jgi:hypothetical protein
VRTRKATNVVRFEDRVEALRKARVELVLEQRAKELHFKQAATGTQPWTKEMTDDDLLAIAQSIVKSSDTFRNCLKFWERPAKKKTRQLAAAERKLARLERKLAEIVRRNGKPSSV